MRYKELTAALIATIALCMTGCVSTRSATSDVRWKMSDVRSDTLREQVVVTVFDTITITKTITIRENENGDTLRMTTVTDRERVRDRSQLKVKSEKLKVETDTVYVEKDSLRLTAYSLPGTEIDEQGNIRHQPSYIRLLKWVFWILLAIIALVLLIRLLPRK